MYDDVYLGGNVVRQFWLENNRIPELTGPK